eukprot:SM000119S25662  [mRNA]  locus=s119:188832:190001:+ [translate_table: standard]
MPALNAAVSLAQVFRMRLAFASTLPCPRRPHASRPCYGRRLWLSAECLFPCSELLRPDVAHAWCSPFLAPLSLALDIVHSFLGWLCQPLFSMGAHFSFQAASYSDLLLLTRVTESPAGYRHAWGVGRLVARAAQLARPPRYRPPLPWGASGLLSCSR